MAETTNSELKRCIFPESYTQEGGRKALFQIEFAILMLNKEKMLWRIRAEQKAGKAV